MSLPVSLLSQSQLNDQTLEVRTRTDARLQQDSMQRAAPVRRGRSAGRARVHAALPPPSWTRGPCGGCHGSFQQKSTGNPLTPGRKSLLEILKNNMTSCCPCQGYKWQGGRV